MNLTLNVAITKKNVAITTAYLIITILCVWFFLVAILGRSLHFVWENMFAYMTLNAIIFIVQFIALSVIFRFFSPKETGKGNDIKDRGLSVACHLVCVAAILLVLIFHSLQLRLGAMAWQAAHIRALLTGEKIYAGLILCVFVYAGLRSMRGSILYQSVAFHAFAVMCFWFNLLLYQRNVVTMDQLWFYDFVNLVVYIAALLASALVSKKVLKYDHLKFKVEGNEKNH